MASIRAAGDSDHPALLELATSFYREEGFDTPASVLSRHLSVLMHTSSARVALAEIDEQCVGFAVTTTKFGLEQGRVAELEDLYVLLAWRNRGIATDLIDDSARWATGHGCRELELVIAPHGHTADLDGYYLRRGFTDTGRRLLSRHL